MSQDVSRVTGWWVFAGILLLIAPERHLGHRRDQ